MVRLYAGEQFRQLHIETKLTFKYAVSNYGRLISYSDDFSDGREIKGGMVEGYKAFTYRYRDEQQNNKVRYKTIYLYRAIADFFLPKPPDATHVIHLDHDKANDHVKNLKWVPRDVMLSHAYKSPKNLERAEKRKLKPPISKLNSTQVIRLKKRLADPNRKTRMKMLAKEFGISEMQVYRIKSGENWGHIKI